MALKRAATLKASSASKLPSLEAVIKKKKKKSKGQPRTHAAKALLEQYGLCPISMEPMRRPVLPSSGQAFDEINIVRYCSSGNRRCPVSGATLKFNKGRVAHTIDFALRNLIRAQAAHAKIRLPSIEKEILFRELRTEFTLDTAKAVVDDCYLGHITLAELSDLLAECMPEEVEASAGCEEEASPAAFPALIAECLACRRADIINTALDFVEAYKKVWTNKRVLNEAIAAAQDPDCRGQILVMLEERVRSKKFDATLVKTVLGFETDSVPVQQFQARIADLIIQQGVRRVLPPGSFEATLNMALRVREDLDSCMDGEVTVDEVWTDALHALRCLRAPIDEATLERLFWRENRMVLHHLAACHEELLAWHLGHHTQALNLCITAIGGHHLSSGLDMDDGIFSSSEDYISETEDSRLPYDEVETALASRAFRGPNSRLV